MAASLTLNPNDYKTVAGTAALSDWDTVVKEEQRESVSLIGPILVGLLTLFVGVGGFFYWASHTEVSQASVAAGKVIVESKTKTVSHLEGGTLKSIAVQEGDKVKAGDLLATLDVTRAQASLNQLHQQIFAAQARLARLTAEKNMAKTFAYAAPTPPGMTDAAAAEIIANETRLFRERTTLQADQLAADQSAITQLESQRVGLTARRQSWAEQAEVLKRDYETYAALEAKQLTTRTLVSQKKIQFVDVQTRVAESDAALAENAQRKIQLELSRTNRRNEYLRALTEQTQQATAEIARASQDIVAAEYAVAKSEIRAPQEGVIANIRLRTPGSAVLSGQPIMDIVPNDQPMMIEGHARPMDIDQIKVGDRAEVKLSAFGAAELKPLVAHVTYIAPDGVADERTGEINFAFRAKLDPDELKKQPNLFLYPGMTAEVYIINGNRTALAYLIDPVTKSFYRAFREQ